MTKLTDKEVQIVSQILGEWFTSKTGSTCITGDGNGASINNFPLKDKIEICRKKITKSSKITKAK